MYRAEPLRVHTARWPASLYEALAEWAHEERRSLNSLVEKICRDALSAAHRLPAASLGPEEVDVDPASGTDNEVVRATPIPAQPAAAGDVGPLPTS